ncbi:DUF1194 domain-containing protein [Defluviimonas sp. D31]|uniref:DUF1194 domain-containing protein n=1 Tax=Defluviimonas sp. D31 TaxID=3083253 RepID=UPI00296E7105|nr:DUF1194 domain-containing protein [Defluviimonas sp. D31]MDW4550502.1 DUF1194 domain-containing protein [Defluviimonas sp. D31]
MIRALALALLCSPPPAAEAGCRQALAIGLDVSGSVDAREFLLQVRGLAAALRAAPVRALLLEAPETPVALAVYDWSGSADQRLILPWTEIRDAATLESVAATIAATNRVPRSPATGVGAALAYGDRLLAQRPDCWRAVLDLTGDGLNNSGMQPRDLRLPERMPPATVNALVIGVHSDEGGEPGIAELTSWFATEVIRGPDAFVETALGFDDFQAAMERKLVKELSGLRIGAADAARRSARSR